MKKIYSFLFGIFGLFLFSSQTFAFDPNLKALEHIKTNSGEHFCSIFNENNFKLCSDFNIKYEGDKIIAGENYIREVSGVFTIQNKKICVVDGQESSDISQCDQVSQIGKNGLNYICTTKNLIETCVQENGNAIKQEVSRESIMNNQIESGNTTSKSNCKVNGKEVDCAEMANDIKTGFTSILKYGAVLGLLGLLATIFYIWMLVHAISKPIPNKVVWILVIFFLSPIGMIVYYFAIKRKFIEGSNTTNTSPQTVPYAVNVGVTYNEGPITTTPPVQTEQVVQPSPSEPQIVLTNENNTQTPTV